MKDTDLPLAPEGMAQLLGSLPVGLALHDEYGRITWVNRELERQMGRRASFIIGKTPEALPLVPSEHQTDEGLLCHLPDAGDGKTEWVMRIDSTLQVDGNAVDVSYYVDMTSEENARMKIDRLHQALRGQVSTDQSTGLLTRKMALAQVDSQVSRSRRYHNLLSVALMRLQCAADNTEQPGEPVVQAVGNLLRDQTRWPDIIGRWDEYTFLLILPETSADSARMLTRKINEALQQHDDVGVLATMDCNAAYGVAEWIKGDNTNDLVNKAIDDLIEALSVKTIASNAG